MPVLDAKILTAGKTIISDALIGLSLALPSKFLVGTTAGYTPLATDVTVTGSLVHTGTANSITATRIAEDTVRYVCVIEENWGPFDIGNLILFMEDSLGAELPFLEVVFPVKITKVQSDPATTTAGFQVPGSRVAINIELKHTDEATIASVTVITPNYSSLPTFSLDIDVPVGPALTYRQFVVSYDLRTKTPVLFTVDDNNVRWGMPFSQQLEDPDFGHLNGGNDGEGYGGVADGIIFGYYYLTTLSQFTLPNIGGSNYTDNVPNTIGNASYLVTTNVGLQTNYIP